MTNVAILWHMHQPYYQDLATGEHILPWVRLHALKDYYGMVALLREFPDLRMTFNLVPSLLAQLEAFAEERAKDRHLELGLKPADTLTENDRSVVLAEFFHASRARMIEPHPRYAELLRKRGEGHDAGKGRTGDFRHRVPLFSDADFLDLQVWHKLSWIDPFYADQDARVRRLIGKERDFTEDDKRILREVELELLRRVIPEYRAAAERGQVELSTSPFYHPILPLLCDTNIYLRTHPGATIPNPPFRHPEDAFEQLTRACEFHRLRFGVVPAGLWPSEGSVSDEATALAVSAGFQWMATDEAILARSLGRGFKRDGQGRLEQPEALYRTYAVRVGSSQIRCLFRDHVLSDLIGFTYAGWDAEAAASDFVDRLADGAQRALARAPGEEPTIAVILDGENAWEHYAGGGRPFLRALYARLSGHPELRTVTMAEATRQPGGTLDGIFPGSWIDGNFAIWIGHPDDQKAWRQLREARKALGEARPTVGAEARERAMEELLIAEGSDWCWWYGDDHSSDHDLEFDDLFRRHLRNLYQALGLPVPDELFVTNISSGVRETAVRAPVGLLRPTLDGIVSSYFEWLSAGWVDTREPTGTMQTGERALVLARAVQFGFDRENLYVLIDPGQRAADALASGLSCSLSFTTPANRRLVVRNDGGGAVVASLFVTNGAGQWRAIADAGCCAFADEVIEASIPFAALGLRAGGTAAFFVALHLNDREVERHPAHRPIEAVVPGDDFERLYWNA